MNTQAKITRWVDTWWQKQLLTLKKRISILLTVEITLVLIGAPLWASRQSVPWVIPWPMPWPLVWLLVLASTLITIFALLQGWSDRGSQTPGWIWRVLWHITHILHSVLWGMGFLFLVPLDPMVANAVLALLTVIGAYALIPIPLTFTTYQLGLLLPATLATSLGFLPADFSVFLLPSASLAVLLVFGLLSFCHSLWSHCDRLYTKNQELSHEQALDWVQEKEELEASIVTLQELSMHDAMTKLPNRRHFDHSYAREWRRSRRQKAPISILMIDIDHFKQYNDEYGHLQGDECLRQVSDVFGMYARRGGDLSARYGGEEFVILLPETPIDHARNLADQIRQAIVDLQIPHVLSKYRVVTVTIGVAAATPEDKQKAKTVIQRADTALYQGKHEGRNCVVLAPPFDSEEITELDTNPHRRSYDTTKW